MKISIAMSSLEQTIRKLNVTYLAEGISDDAKSQISSELEALDWAIGFIKDRLVRTAIVIGHPDFMEPLIKDLNDIPKHRLSNHSNDHMIIKRSEDLVTIIIYDVLDLVLEMCHGQFNPDGLDGDLLRQDYILDYIICHRYYGAMDVDDENKKVVFFNTSIRTEYVDKVTPDLVTWARNIYSQIKWGTFGQK